jgi:hypothetical protein
MDTAGSNHGVAGVAGPRVGAEARADAPLRFPAFGFRSLAARAAAAAGEGYTGHIMGRGLHSSASQLSLNRF